MLQGLAESARREALNTRRCMELSRDLKVLGLVRVYFCRMDRAVSLGEEVLGYQHWMFGVRGVG